VRRRFNGPESELVHHFERRRSDGARGDLGDGLGSVVHRLEDREQGFDRFREARQPHDHLCHDAERSFRADQDACQIVAGRVENLAAGVDQLAVGEHHFETEHMVGGDAVGERVRPARVLRHVAPDGAGFLA